MIKTRYLLNFGDSWAHGYDAGDVDNRYANIMASSLGSQLIDCSIPSSSVPRMILQLKDFLQNLYDPNNNYTALFFITAQERQLIFDYTGQPKDLSVGTDADYYKEYFNTRLGNFTLNTSIITIQTMCEKYGINDWYMLGWQYPTLWPEVNSNKFYEHGNKNAVNLILQSDEKIKFYDLDMSKLIGFKNGHPSADGHRKIASDWLSWINSRSSTTDQ